ncbi:hypothetical protein [Prosthecomicrobium sp. N25]|uniref:hypothetical protein n=1 Tax=Prosthecomicrobium sp. N25 TaxID=3129254 RepID=UPI003076AFCE
MTRSAILEKSAWLVLASIFAMPAAAQDVSTVKSGVEGVVYSFYVYGDGCASSGGQRMSIRTPPANGVAKVARIPVKIPPGKPCAGQTIKVGVVTYKSRPGFRGTDQVGIDTYMNTYSNGVAETYFGKTVTVQVQ